MVSCFDPPDMSQAISFGNHETGFLSPLQNPVVALPESLKLLCVLHSLRGGLPDAASSRPTLDNQNRNQVFISHHRSELKSYLESLRRLFRNPWKVLNKPMLLSIRKRRSRMHTLLAATIGDSVENKNGPAKPSANKLFFRHFHDRSPSTPSCPPGWRARSST